MMLRRKMFLFLGGLMALLVVASAVAIWLLQGVLVAMDHTTTTDAAVIERTQRMGDEVNQIEMELRELQLGRSRHFDALVEDIQKLKSDTAQLGDEFPRLLPAAGALYRHVTQSLDAFEDEVGMLATAQDEGLARSHMDAAISASVALRQDIRQVERLMRDHAAGEEHAAIAWFRWVVLALAIVFLVVINVSVMMLLRMGQMVLRPMEQLVEGSRRLAREEFDYRVQVSEADEFGELAESYNHLAEQLQANERRKLETLGQASVTLNHELNNAGAIIKLQLELMERQSGGNAAFARSLKQIRDGLARMTITLERLKHVRRIVLADYSADTKMLDLEKSAEEEAIPEHVASK